MGIVSRYIAYVRDIRRYSERTVSLYEKVLSDFLKSAGNGKDMTDEEVVGSMTVPILRDYVVDVVERGLSARTISLHMSALSGFCSFLMKHDLLKSNPVKLVTRPKVGKRLSPFYKKVAMDGYFESTSWVFDDDAFDFFLENHASVNGKKMYEYILSRVIISMLYNLGVRRAELIGLTIGDVDFGRNVVKVRGKGDKMREIPLISSLSQEIMLYLKAVETMCEGKRSLKEPLLVTYKGRKLYPVYVDRAVKSGLGGRKDITGQKSPHVLRHSLATELMNGDADINSVKEMLGHSSLATTQIYTHSSIVQLKNSYKRAHPRAKNGGKHGD